MSERFKVTKHEEPKTYKNYGATSAECDVELKGKLLQDSGKFSIKLVSIRKVVEVGYWFQLKLAVKL